MCETVWSNWKLGENGSLPLFSEKISNILLFWKYAGIYYLFWNSSLWNSSLPWISSSKNSRSLKKCIQKNFKNFLWYSKSWNSSTIKNFQNFSIVLEFHKLEYQGKLDFTTLEYPKSSTSLHNFETMVDCNIVCKKVLFGYFFPWKLISTWKMNFSTLIIDLF